MKIPDANHPITIAAAGHRVRITHRGRVIADSRSALVLKEANYPEVFYIPREDADLTALARSGHTTHCPYKGDASYYSVVNDGGASINVVWSYEEPFEAMSAIAGYLAFYPQRVDAIEALPLKD